MNVGVQGGLSKLKKKHFRVKHQKVKLFRANEPLVSVFMWGVNHTVSSFANFAFKSLSRVINICVFFVDKRIESCYDTSYVTTG